MKIYKSTFLILGLIFLFLTTSVAKADFVITSKGEVLGKSDTIRGNENSGVINISNNPNNSSNQNNSDSSNSSKSIVSSSGQIIQNPSAIKSIHKETVTSEVTQAPKVTNFERKSSKIELKNINKQIKLQYVDKNNKPVSKESSASGEVVIEKPESEDFVKISASGTASYLMHNRILAKTHFPLMVNLDTNELIVTTPKGQKVVTVLPDKAVEHMLAANVLDQAGGKGGLLWLEYQKDTATSSASPIESPSVTQSATLTPEPTSTESSSTSEITPTPIEQTTASEEIALTQNSDGTLVYEIPGKKEKKLLGLLKVLLKRTAVVSAETGELINVKQDLLTSVIDRLSF